MLGTPDARRHAMPPSQLIETIYQRIRESGIEVQGARIGLDGGRVTLAGHTQSYFDQQRIQELLRPIPGVTELVNRLQVVAAAPASAETPTTALNQLSQSGSSSISGN